jgi:hypothetical protein
LLLAPLTGVAGPLQKLQQPLLWEQQQQQRQREQRRLDPRWRPLALSQECAGPTMLQQHPLPPPPQQQQHPQ